MKTHNQACVRPRRARGQLGAAMMEMVLALPLLLVILSLLFLFGRLMVRAQHTQVMARYEAWRDVADAPGPRPRATGDLGSPGYDEMNRAFFANNASSIGHRFEDDRFPTDTYDLLIQAARAVNEDVGSMVEAFLYQPQSENPRMSHGHREGFRVAHEMDLPLWERFEGPISRQHVRVGTEWHYVNRWQASANRWESGGGPTPHHLRAIRDVFLDDFDQRLDALDGETSREYSSDDTQVATNEVLAGFLRTLYLDEPRYRGPIVYDERP